MRGVCREANVNERDEEDDQTQLRLAHNALPVQSQLLHRIDMQTRRPQRLRQLRSVGQVLRDMLHDLISI